MASRCFAWISVCKTLVKHEHRICKNCLQIKIATPKQIILSPSCYKPSVIIIVNFLLFQFQEYKTEKFM